MSEVPLRVHSQQHQVECDLLFVAAGRKPALDGLNLEAAGITYSDRGIEVNSTLQTSTSTIYAAGDVLGGEQFSHLAGWQGFQAARNALLPGSKAGFTSVMPRVTFTDPEVAQIAMTSAEALAAHPDATIVSRRAGEAIMEIVLAIQQKLKVSDLASTIHPYPTYNSGIQLLATEIAVEQAADSDGVSIRTINLYTLPDSRG